MADVNMTTEEAGKELAKMAELTSKVSQNWQNFAGICEQMLLSAYRAGYEKGRIEGREELRAQQTGHDMGG